MEWLCEFLKDDPFFSCRGGRGEQVVLGPRDVERKWEENAEGCCLATLEVK